MWFRTFSRRGYGAGAALAAALAMLLLFASAPALAQEGPPATPSAFYGQVFEGSYGGQAAPDGATVEIYAEDEPRGEPMQVADGWYGGPLGTDPKYLVPGTEADAGKKLVFKVNGTPADTYDANGRPITVTFQFDQVLQVDLVIPDTMPPVLTLKKPAAFENLPYKAADYTGDNVFEWTANEDLETAATPTATFAAAAAASVNGTVTFRDARAVWVVPAADLLPGTAYTLTVTGIKDGAGNEAEPVQVQFTTMPRVTLPEGQLTQPEPIAFSGGNVEVILPAGTEVGSDASLEARPVAEPPAVPVDLRVAGQVVDFTVQGVKLPESGKFTIRLKADPGARAPAIYYYDETAERWERVPGSTYDSETGFVRAEVEHLSIYGVLEDSEPPVVVGPTEPENGAAYVPVGVTITVTFSEDVQPGEAYGDIALNDADGNPVEITTSIEGAALTITPAEALAYNTVYTVVIPAGAVKDAADNALAEKYVFSFTTETAAVVLERLEVTPDSLTLTVGEQAQLEVKAVYSDGSVADITAQATYASEDEGVAAVSGAGLITAVGAGSTMVTATHGGKEAQATVIVSQYVGDTPSVQVFPGTQGTEPGQIQAGGGVRVQVPVKVSRAYESALVIIRIDDPDGRPLLAAVEGPLPANTTMKFSAGFNLPAKGGTYKVKAFVWDGWQFMKVLTPPYEGTFNAAP